MQQVAGVSEGERMERSEVRRLVDEVVGRLLPASGAPAASATARVDPAVPSAPTSLPAPPQARWHVWSAPARHPLAPATTAAAPGPPETPAGDVSRVVAIGADHGAFRLKQQLVRYLREDLRWQVLDCGTHSEEAVDYPDVARDVALAVTGRRAARGVVLDAMGIGSAMAANRVPGALCAVCHDEQTVRNAREHNDANVLSLGSRVVHPGQARALVRLFLTTPHAGGRHARRVAKIRGLEALHPVSRGT